MGEQLVEGFSPLERLLRRGPADESRTVLEQAHFCQVSHCVTHPKHCASLWLGMCVFGCFRVCYKPLSESLWWRASFMTKLREGRG